MFYVIITYLFLLCIFIHHLYSCIYIDGSTYTAQPLTLFTRTDLGTAVSVSVVVTTALFTIIGFGLGLLIMYLFMRKKIVYLLAKKQTNVGPTVPAGPIYEEVLPKEEIKLNSNQAYGPVGL